MSLKRHCERSEAIQLLSRKKMDCFVADAVIGPAKSPTRWLLVMTVVMQEHAMSSLFMRTALFVTLCLASPVGMASAQTADTVLFNGKIVTVDSDFSVQQALAIGHGQVLASGTSADMKKLAGDKTRLI